MKFGMNLLLWTGDINDSILPVVESLKKIGFDGVELPMFAPDEKKFAAVGKKLDGLGSGTDGRDDPWRRRQSDQP